MPVIKSAIKKARKDKTRTSRNAKRSGHLKQLIRSLRKSPNQKKLTAVFSALDKTAKVHLIHKNTASRLKSRLSKLVSKK